MHALRSVKDIMVFINCTKGLKKVSTVSEIKIAKIDSGKIEMIPISAMISGHSLQSIMIEVKGKTKNPFGNADINFQTGEELGMIYDDQKKTFNMETSFEAMTKKF